MICQRWGLPESMMARMIIAINLKELFLITGHGKPSKHNNKFFNEGAEIIHIQQDTGYNFQH